MKTQKIRGHKKIWKNIETWKEANKQLDLEHVKNYHREYTKVWVRPYSDLCLGNSITPIPKGKTRQKIVDGLFEIHANWKKQLDTLNVPYYLKIWFYHPDVSRSQVVCAIGDFINFYDITFFKPEKEKKFPFDMRGYTWEYRHHEEHLDEDDIGLPYEYVSMNDYIENKKWVEKRMKKSHRISTEKYDDGIVKTYHSFKTSDVWLGSTN